jgi:hypothetical protein
MSNMPYMKIGLKRERFLRWKINFWRELNIGRDVYVPCGTSVTWTKRGAMREIKRVAGDETWAIVDQVETIG